MDILISLFLFLGLGLLFWGYLRGRAKGYGHLTSLTTNPLLLNEIPPRQALTEHDVRRMIETARTPAAPPQRSAAEQADYEALLARIDAAGKGKGKRRPLEERSKEQSGTSKKKRQRAA